MKPMTYSKDKTMSDSYLKRMLSLVSEYEQIKMKQSLVFKKLDDFYTFNDICRQNFLKIYNRFKQSGYDLDALLPQKRGPKYKDKRPDILLRDKLVLDARTLGNNKFLIRDIVKNVLGDATPSLSTIYNILRRNGRNKLKVSEKPDVKRIIKEKIGEMGHIDCHHLPMNIIENNRKKYYLVALLDDCSRVAWCKRLSDLKSMSVMFGTMHCFSIFKSRYGIEFDEILSDNGAEFGGQCKTDEAKMENPFKRLLHEMDIKHRHTKPYRPQTNGKIERFWRTISEDFIDGTTFDSVDELDNELNMYMLYYNEHRPHQGINGKKPIDVVNEQKKIEPN